MKKRVDVEALRPGMYVAELDRPWLGTPFLFQGFYLMSETDINVVRQTCHYVFIDTEKGLDVDEPRVARPTPPERTRRDSRVVYREEISFEDEISQAKAVHTRTREQIESMFRDARLGRNVDVEGAKVIVADMVDSIVRMPDAQLWLSNLRKRDEYTAIHSLNVCIFALTFGRHLGLPKDRLNELGLGALMHDIGKMRVPLEILNKEGALTEREFDLMKSHTTHGLDILSRHARYMPRSTIEVAHSHHERAEGQGYPRGLAGEEIDLYARMVAIVDVYDAITSDRVYHKGMSTLAALKRMFQWREKSLDRRLVEQFIQCIGIYPVGSLVELNTGEVGIVISIAQGRRLTPKLILVRDARKQPYQPPRLIDMSMYTKDSAGPVLEIKRVLEPNAYGINVKEYIVRELPPRRSYPRSI